MYRVELKENGNKGFRFAFLTVQAIYITSGVSVFSFSFFSFPCKGLSAMLFVCHYKNSLNKNF